VHSVHLTPTFVTAGQRFISALRSLVEIMAQQHSVLPKKGLAAPPGGLLAASAGLRRGVFDTRALAVLGGESGAFEETRSLFFTACRESEFACFLPSAFLPGVPETEILLALWGTAIRYVTQDDAGLPCGKLHVALRAVPAGPELDASCGGGEHIHLSGVPPTGTLAAGYQSLD
jgi:hypothetical protein